MASLVTILPLVFQGLLGLMAIIDKFNMPGADKKAVVTQGLQVLTPVIIKALPASTQAEVTQGEAIASSVINAAAGAIDSIHAEAKKNPTFYSAIEAHLAQADTIAHSAQEVVQSVLPEITAGG